VIVYKDAMSWVMKCWRAEERPYKMLTHYLTWSGRHPQPPLVGLYRMLTLALFRLDGGPELQEAADLLDREPERANQNPRHVPGELVIWWNERARPGSAVGECRFKDLADNLILDRHPLVPVRRFMDGVGYGSAKTGCLGVLRSLIRRRLTHEGGPHMDIGGQLVRLPVPPRTEFKWPEAAALIRDVFPDPRNPEKRNAPEVAELTNYSPISELRPLRDEWLTSTVLSLAHAVWEDRDFSALPILADALQDAGCERVDLLTHLRGDDLHCRGCWALELILRHEQNKQQTGRAARWYAELCEQDPN
jgi:hypothetical protein